MNTLVKITPLVENQTKDSHLIPEHGLSLLVECGKRILWDTGASTSSLIKNAAHLAVNLADIDCVVLSHGHYDHTGGLECIKGKKVYVHPDIFIPKYHRIANQYKYIGLPHTQEHYKKENRLEFVEVQQNIAITEDVKLHLNFKKQENKNFYINRGGDYLQDIFTEELALSINTSKGLVIVSGCAHSGILNIIEKVIADNGAENIYALLGGFHLAQLPQEAVEKTAKELKRYSIKRIGVSHCTGSKLAQYLDKTFVFDFNLGESFIC